MRIGFARAGLRDAAAVERWRDGVLVFEDGVEVGEGLTVLLDFTGEAIETAEAFHFFGMAEARGFERAAQDAEGFVVGGERDGEGVTIFAAVSEGEAGRVGEAAGRSVDDFGDERQRLQGARAEAFHEEEGGEVAEVLVVSDGEDGAEALQIDVGGPDVVVRGHDEAAGLAER